MHLLYLSTSFCIILLHSPLATQCICYIVQLVSVFLRRRSFSAALEARCAPLPSLPLRKCWTQFKPFHPLINLLLTHGALSILSQHTTVNFHRFHSCPKNPHYAMLFFDGAILQRSVHVFALVAATRLKTELCTANGWTLQQALSILHNAPAPLFPGYRVI